ncbi:GTP-binding protein [Isoalcanivorax beigongshangi]|uniref:ATP/GTP-binding protein n=1 Tax=Isoalcanivorax beigongshangi TaxID=3238810 RepID=A0ABV4AE59_9GAMM
MTGELKFIFTGTPGVGKTTAIRAVSDTVPVSTDVLATDELAAIKSHTTAALDFGELRLENGDLVRLYGTPGQERFEFMWDILAEGALGLVVLVDHSRPQAVQDMCLYLDSFKQLVARTGAVVAVTRHPQPDTAALTDYQDALEARGLCLPVLAVDIRQAEDVRLLLDVLMTTAEY